MIFVQRSFGVTVIFHRSGPTREHTFSQYLRVAELPTTIDVTCVQMMWSVLLTLGAQGTSEQCGSTTTACPTTKRTAPIPCSRNSRNVRVYKTNKWFTLILLAVVVVMPRW